MSIPNVGCCHWAWWINRSPSAKTLQAGVFAMRQSGQATSAWSETHLTSSADPSLHHSMPCHGTSTWLRWLSSGNLWQGAREDLARSIAGWFFPLPSLECVAGSVAPPGCPLALAAARALLAALREDAQSASRRATTPDGLGAVEPVGKWPTYVVRALPPHAGRSDSPAR